MDVLALLDTKGIKVTPKGGYEYSIICPNSGQHQDGSDSIPSFNINIQKLKGHCFACNFSMNEVGLHKWLLGEELDESQMRSLKIKSAMKRIKEDTQLTLVESTTSNIMFPVGEDWNEDFRGIRADTFRQLGAINCRRGRYADRICFPIYVDGVLIGVDARTLVGAQPKYLRPFGCNCKDDWLFPFDEVKRMTQKSLILGEGLFHGINCFDKGYRGLCFFGSNNWSQNKLLKLMELKGVREVIYFRDEDKAGKLAEQSICSSLVSWFDVSVIADGSIPENKDLGDLSGEEIELALSTRVKPKLPKCMVDNPFMGIKLAYGSPCYERKCPFYSNGICINNVGGVSG